MINGRKTNAATAYFHLPPIWLKDNPYGVSLAERPALDEEVYARTLTNGIHVAAHRDGLFRFNFESWEPGDSVFIPHFDSNTGGVVTEERLEAEEKAVLHIYRRVEVMNVHIVSLNTAVEIHHNQALSVKQVVSPNDVINIHDRNGRWEFALNPFYYPSHALIAIRRNTEPPKDSRSVISMDAVEKSYEILETILTSKIGDATLMASHLLRSAKAYGEHDFSSSLIYSWTVIEKTLAFLWNALIESNRTRQEGKREINFINSRRKQKLEGRDYTASVRTEVLSFMGIIDFTLYNDINELRYARNEWLHRFVPISSTIAASGIRNACRLFNQATGIEVKLTPSHVIQY